jgi:transposase
MTESPNSSDFSEQHELDVKDVAKRLAVSVSTLNGWLKEDEKRAPGTRVFDFHRSRGRTRKWSEEGYAKLEFAINRESRSGVLAGWRTREKSRQLSPPDPDAEAALAEVLGTRRERIY